MKIEILMMNRRTVSFDNYKLSKEEIVKKISDKTDWLRLGIDEVVIIRKSNICTVILKDDSESKEKEA